MKAWLAIGLLLIAGCATPRPAPILAWQWNPDRSIYWSDGTVECCVDIPVLGTVQPAGGN